MTTAGALLVTLTRSSVLLLTIARRRSMRPSIEFSVHWTLGPRVVILIVLETVTFNEFDVPVGLVLST